MLLLLLLVVVVMLQCEPVMIEKRGSSICGYRTDEYNWRYDNDELAEDLPGDAKASAIKAAPSRTTGKGRGKYEMRQSLKDEKVEASISKENTSNISEIFKNFSTGFDRLNGILFTRTSLETFEEVLLMVKNDLLELLSSGSDEKYSFGSDAADSKLAIIRLVAILIFTIHNVIRESDNQLYDEILQR
ncbi:hypothetical protein FXO38_27822 [Capsicum annuum]|nr:hypothetical protein FXO38_27822 [Capsicum annuum]